MQCSALKLASFLLLAPFVTSSLSLQAFPAWGELPPSPRAASFASPYDYRGIVALNNCSGSLVRFDDSQDSDAALVLTNGHCVGRIAAGKARYKQAVNRSFDLLNEKGGRLAKVRATQLLYATMSKTDLALYQLDESYGSILERSGIEALTFARTMPELDTEIEIISGYWKTGYSCSIEAIAFGLKEGDWLYEDSMRYSRPGCEVKGGTSGSPVLAAGTRQVIAINNSGNQSGQKCTINNPCEIAADGTISYQKGFNYAQQTYWLYACRDEAGRFDINLSSCLLPKAL